MSDKDLTQRYRKKVYLGRSGRKGRTIPSLEKALKQAYDAAAKEAPAARGKKEERRYRVLDIWAVGTNPLSEYIVSIEVDD
jgi:hypothetical protein